jgi:SAM-dependent methyltransferase
LTALEAVPPSLAECEAAIERGLTTFVEVGQALLTIRDQRLYRETHGDFDTYCRERWGWTRKYADQIAAASVVAGEVTAIAGTPSNEAQVRPLTKLPTPEARREAWAEANRAADEAGERVTARHVAEAAARLGTPAEMVETPEGDSAVIIGDECRFFGDPDATPTPEAPPPITKPDLGGGVSHPARYSSGMVEFFASMLDQVRHHRVLDPFAGTGGIHALTEFGFDTVGVELEPEWARLHDRTICGSALELPFDGGTTFDAIVTSPTYGNRLADSHNASDPHLRRSYTHDLGRQLSDGSSGAMQWGDEYREFHRAAWAEAKRVLAFGGRFVLNIKDHIRGGEWQDVAGWHVDTLVELGFCVRAIRPFAVTSLRAGANADARVPCELVISLDLKDP